MSEGGDVFFKRCFGPVPSRRLGRSLGVNNIPYKTCSYSCIYCQLGRTVNLSVERKCFYDWRGLVEEVVGVIKEIKGRVDYITFVPDGEPLLDKCIDLEIEGVKREVSTPIAVLTNASLLYLEEAREDLASADLVSLKIDALSENTWRRINRPHPALELEMVLKGMEAFARGFKGRLITETMLVDRFNTDVNELERVARFIKRLNPFKTYVAIPVRPPAEPFVRPPPPQKLVEAYNVFNEILEERRVELLNLPEPPAFTAHGDPEKWLLSVTSVHPLRVEYALKALSDLIRNPEEVINKLREEGKIEVVEYSKEKFVVRSFKS